MGVPVAVPVVGLLSSRISGGGCEAGHSFVPNRAVEANSINPIRVATCKIIWLPPSPQKLQRPIVLLSR